MPKQPIEVFKALGMNPGAFCVAGVREADRLRVMKSKYKAEKENKGGERSSGEKIRRKVRRINK